MDLGLWIGILALIVAAVTLYYQRRQTLIMVQQTPGQARRPRWLNVGTLTLIFLVVLAWTPWILQPKAPLSWTPIEGFGLRGQPFTFHARINTGPLKEHKYTHYLMLIVRIQYSNVDRLSDTFIDKSGPFTLDGSDVDMSLVGKVSPLALRIDPTLPAVTVEYNAVMVPRSFSADQILSLNDVERLGGRILSHAAQTIPFKSLGIVVAPAPETTTPK